jgi:hypothetical protein
MMQRMLCITLIIAAVLIAAQGGGPKTFSTPEEPAMLLFRLPQSAWLPQ